MSETKKYKRRDNSRIKRCRECNLKPFYFEYGISHEYECRRCRKTSDNTNTEFQARKSWNALNKKEDTKCK